MRAALTPTVSAVAILVRGDVIALRYALLVEHLLPEVRLVVTLFDRTVAEQLVRVVPNCQVTSPANVAVPSITGRRADDGPPRGRRHRDPALATTRMVAQPAWDAVGPGCSHDAATRILFIGLWGLASILVLDWFLAVTALHENGPIAEP
jgi:hypothetical protein